MKTNHSMKFAILGFIVLLLSNVSLPNTFSQPAQEIYCSHDQQRWHRCLLTWHPHESILAIGSDDSSAEEDYEISLWDMETQQPLATLRQPGTYPTAMEWSSDGDFLATVASFLVYIWDVNGATLRQTINIDEYIANMPELELPYIRFISSISWHPDGSQFAIAFDGFASIFNLETNEFTVIQTDSSQNAVIVDWSPDGTKLVVVNSSSISVYDTSRFEEVFDIQFPDGAFVGRSDSSQVAAWSPNGQQFAVGVAINPVQGPTILSAVVVFDLSNGEVQQTFETETGGFINAITWHPDNQLLATANGNVRPRVGERSNEDFIQIWDITTGESIHVEEYETPVTSIAWGPSGDQLAFSLADGTVEIQNFPIQ